MPAIIFIDGEGREQSVEASLGQTLLDVAQANDFDIEGACEGCMACSTCHIIVDQDWFKKLPKPSEEEEDILDLAFGLTRTSRLGCQITVTEKLDGLRITLPVETRNMLLD